MNRLSPLAIGLLLLASAVADAQSRSGGGRSSGSSFGSSGSSFGSGGSGSNSDISSGFGSQSFGNTDQFGQSTGMSALSSGMGGSATGLGRSSSSSSGSGNRTRTNASSSGRMSSTGVNRSSVSGMSGQRSPGRSSMMGNMGGLSSMMSGMNGMNGLGRGALSNRGVGVQQSVRPVIQVNMEAPQSLAPIVVSQSINSALAQAPSLNGVRQLNVNVDADGVATIRGSASTSHDRTLAAAMLSLQPGVRSVQNEIALPPIASPPPTNR